MNTSGLNTLEQSIARTVHERSAAELNSSRSSLATDSHKKGRRKGCSHGSKTSLGHYAKRLTKQDNLNDSCSKFGEALQNLESAQKALDSRRNNKFALSTTSKYSNIADKISDREEELTIEDLKISSQHQLQSTHKDRESFSQDSFSSLEGSFHDLITAGGSGLSAATDPLAVLENWGHASGHTSCHRSYASFDLHNLSKGDNLLLDNSHKSNGINFEQDGDSDEDLLFDRRTDKRKSLRKTERTKVQAVFPANKSRNKSSRRSSRTEVAPLSRSATTDGIRRKDKEALSRRKDKDKAHKSTNGGSREKETAPHRRTAATDATGRRNKEVSDKKSSSTGTTGTSGGSGNSKGKSRSKRSERPHKSSIPKSPKEEPSLPQPATADAANTRKLGEVSPRRSIASKSRRSRDRARAVAGEQLRTISLVAPATQGKSLDDGTATTTCTEFSTEDVDAASKKELEARSAAALARGPSVSTAIATKIRNDPALLEKFLEEVVEEDAVKSGATMPEFHRCSVVTGADQPVVVRRRSPGERTEGKRRVRSPNRESFHTKSGIQAGTYRMVNARDK